MPSLFVLIKAVVFVVVTAGFGYFLSIGALFAWIMPKTASMWAHDRVAVFEQARADPPQRLGRAPLSPALSSRCGQPAWHDYESVSQLADCLLTSPSAIMCEAPNRRLIALLFGVYFEAADTRLPDRETELKRRLANAQSPDIASAEHHRIVAAFHHLAWTGIVERADFGPSPPATVQTAFNPARSLFVPCGSGR